MDRRLELQVLQSHAYFLVSSKPGNAATAAVIAAVADTRRYIFQTQSHALFNRVVVISVHSKMKGTLL